jgi:hypothetical protein
MIDDRLSAASRFAMHENLSPSDFVAFALQKSSHDFLAVHGDSHLLFIRLDDPTGELAAGLAATMTGHGELAKPNLDIMGYHTVVQTDPLAARPQWGAGSRVDADLVRKRCDRAPHFVVPLRKRATETSTYVERISVGRARNKDVVLRHRSVSKFHGWFERDGAGDFHVADSGSKNGIQVNGKLIEARQLTRIVAGDLVTFGAIETFICPPDVFWNAVRG